MKTSLIEDRTARIENDLKEDMRHIRSKLQELDVDRIELASIAGHRGSEWHGTDSGFALARFLDHTGSICNSPPPSLPGSPVALPSVPGSEIGNPMSTVLLDEPLDGSKGNNALTDSRIHKEVNYDEEYVRAGWGMHIGLKKDEIEDSYESVESMLRFSLQNVLSRSTEGRKYLSNRIMHGNRAKFPVLLSAQNLWPLSICVICIVSE
jgi:hypothetical protein